MMPFPLLTMIPLPHSGYRAPKRTDVHSSLSAKEIAEATKRGVDTDPADVDRIKGVGFGSSFGHSMDAQAVIKAGSVAKLEGTVDGTCHFNAIFIIILH